MRILIIITFIAAALWSCNDKNRSDRKIEIDSIRNSNSDQSELSWTKIKDKFPNQDILQYDFKANGQPMNDLSKAIKLDSLAFKELVSKVKRYSEWKEYLEIFYLSKNKIENQEVGIFLVIKAFDGTEYTFDLIKIDDKGEISKIETIATSWTAAECLGYTRATIDLKSNQIFQEILQKCYDEETENNEAIDSIINIISLKNLDFNTLKTDTIK